MILILTIHQKLRCFFNDKYNIFHYNSIIAFIQEKRIYDKNEYYCICNDVYIFDKLSYSKVDHIKTNDKLLMVYRDMMLFFGKFHLKEYYYYAVKIHISKYIPSMNKTVT